MHDAIIRVRLACAFCRATRSILDHVPVPNGIDRGFHAEAQNCEWAGDVTCVATGEGWPYLATTIDLHSCEVVGWATGEHSDKGLTGRSLPVAIGATSPAPDLIAHSDRESTYASVCLPRCATWGRHRVRHEPTRRLPGQRGGGKLLEEPGKQGVLRYLRQGGQLDLRVDRGVLDGVRCHSMLGCPASLEFLQNNTTTATIAWQFPRPLLRKRVTAERRSPGVAFVEATSWAIVVGVDTAVVLAGTRASRR